MRLYQSALVCVLCMTMLQEVTSFGGLFQELGREFEALGKHVAKSLIKVGMDAVNKTVSIGCRTACPRLCKDKIGMFFCPFTCMPLCNRGKRSIRQGSDYSGHLLPMPNKFSAYDLNDDGRVSLKELAFVTGMDQATGNVHSVFQATDINADSFLSPKELYEGPFVFEMDVSDNDNLHCQYIASRRNPARHSQEGNKRIPDKTTV